MVVRHEKRDSRLHPVREHTAYQLSATGTAQLDGFKDGGTSVHTGWHTRCVSSTVSANRKA